MEKLYYTEKYTKEFVAEIENINEKNGKYHIVLDKSAFFPGGGGQIADRGVIGDQKVVDVYEEDGTLYHVLDKKPIKIHRVKCEIDWKRRFDGMQQHLAQHLLSGCFYKLFTTNTVSVHFGEKISTVDIQGILSDEQIRAVEVLANEKIDEDLKVEVLIPEKKDLKKLKLRRDLPKTNEKIRVLKIEDLDINACCGIHPDSTIELRCIKIKKFEKNRGNTRIEFLAGKRAIDETLKIDVFSREICKYLNSNEEEAISSIKKMNETLSEINATKSKLEKELANYEMKDMLNNCEKVEDISIIMKVYQNENVKYLNKLVAKFIDEENRIVLFACINETKVNMIFAISKNLSKKLNISDVLKDSITLIDGNGGGNSTLAQGAGKNNGNIENALNYAKDKISQFL
ncbi:MAG: alanyl-tRNA editing protein [Sarcina sp.]